MLATRFGIFSVFLLCCCSKHQGKIDMPPQNKTSIALAGETLHFSLNVTVPVNNTEAVTCYKKDSKKEILKKSFDKYDYIRNEHIVAVILMHNSSASGEYCCEYMNKHVTWMVLVRDMGYLKPNDHAESDVIVLLVITMVLLLFSIIGSIYIYKWHKAHSGGDNDGGKKRGNTVVATDVGKTSESIYTDLEPRPVSIYDVLNVDEARGKSTQRHASKKRDSRTHKDVASEEGAFESVYENYQ